jgi:hypothetical protein
MIQMNHPFDMPPPPPFPRMTPQCEKKRDDVLSGHDMTSDPIATMMPDRAVPGKPQQPVSRTFECTTTRKLLRQVPKTSSAVAAICQSIQTRLVTQFQSTLWLTIDFEPRSSKWRISRSPSKFETSEVHIVMTKICSPVQGEEKYTLSISGEPSKLLDTVHFCVRKAVVRLEFPDFPDGCKSVKFRSVYQLNERVSGAKQRECLKKHSRLVTCAYVAQFGYICDRMQG